MLVREIMKEPVCIGAEESLAAAVGKLKHDNVGCLPVCEGRQVIGMLTDRDILLRSAGDRRDVNHMKAREAMSVEVYCCSEDDPVEQAATVMTEKHVRRLPVLDHDRQLVGVVSLTDIGGGQPLAARYEVVFYKELTNSCGHPHHVEWKRVAVAPGHTKQEAIDAAIKQVEAETHAAWKSSADGFDVTEVLSDEQGRIIEKVEQTSEKEERIRRRAYDLWERKGCPSEGEVAHWAQATREIEAEDAARAAAGNTKSFM